MTRSKISYPPLRNTSVIHFVRSLGYALRGILYCLKHELNFRIQLAVSLSACALGLLLQISASEWVAVLMSIMLVSGLEIINTAIESLSDAVASEYHPLIKVTKDVSAGAVLLVAILSAVIGLIIFIPRVISFLNQ